MFFIILKYWYIYGTCICTSSNQINWLGIYTRVDNYWLNIISEDLYSFYPKDLSVFLIF